MWWLWAPVVALAGRSEPSCEATPIRLAGVVVASRTEVRSGLPFTVARIRVEHTFQGSFAPNELADVWTAGGTLPSGVRVISSSTSGSAHPLVVHDRVIVGARQSTDGRLLRGGNPFDLMRETPEGVLTANGKRVVVADGRLTLLGVTELMNEGMTSTWPPGPPLEAAPSVLQKPLTEPSFDELVALMTADPAVLECREPAGDRAR